VVFTKSDTPPCLMRYMLKVKKKAASILILLPLFWGINPAGARENSTELYKEGSRHAINGDIDGAIPIFKRVIAISPFYSLGHYGLGKAYLYKPGRIDDAIKHLRRAVTLDKKLSKGYFYLGLALMFNRSYIHAIHSFSNAYKYDTTSIEALYNIAVIYDMMESQHRANKYYEMYLYQKTKENSDIIF
jgi:tetratricopeptide (TPR) repeat protein